TVTAEDAFGNTATGYTGTVTFTSNDGQAVLPADYTFSAGDAGIHTFTLGVTLKTAGSEGITVADTADSSITGSDTVTVRAASASHYTLTAQASTTAGNAFGVTVSAVDPYGNIDKSYTGTAHFSSSDPQATLPADYAFVSGDNGVHTFSSSVTLKTAGSRTI